jgi:hypothetical protein
MVESSYYKKIIESLRKGVPPKRGVQEYSVGHDKLIDGIKQYLLDCISDTGIIRFVCGSWGSGKTHLFRLLTEVGCKENIAISTVELNATNTLLNKFNTIFAEIIRQIKSPHYYQNTEIEEELISFNSILQESYYYHCCGVRNKLDSITPQEHDKAVNNLMANRQIDIDFKKMVVSYWNTLREDAPDCIQKQDEIIQWFCGEGTIGQYRKKYGISKIITKENSKLMLQSLVNFLKFSGYKGLMILFDEAEQYYSIIRKSDLQQAHNNLLALINNIESLSGLILIYATTPDFFIDEKYGIQRYGALAGRIGKPEENRPPRAMDIIWNLDVVKFEKEQYFEVSKKIRDIYGRAYPDTADKLPDDAELMARVEELYGKNHSMSQMRFWRLFVIAIINILIDHVEGTLRTTDEITNEIIRKLKEDDL